MTKLFSKSLIALVMMTALTACVLPRGVGMTKEIVEEEKSETPSYQVERVTRANLQLLQKWPSNGHTPHYHWPKKTKYPNSNLIRVGDRVDLTIWDSEENSLLTNAATKTVSMPNLVVSASGTIFVPYVGEIKITGMSPAAARDKIQADLSAAIPSAQVQLGLQAGTKNSANVVSGVNSPGTFPLPNRNFSVIGLISQGGGIIKDLRNPLVQLQRGSKTYKIRAQTLFANASRNIPVRGDDSIIVVEDERFFTTFGATGNEQVVYFPKDRITALEALSMAGGLSDSRANPKGVVVMRDYPRRALRQDKSGPNLPQVLFVFDMTSADGLFAARQFQILPMDTVVATESPVTSVRTVLGLIGSVVGVSRSVSSASSSN